MTDTTAYANANTALTDTELDQTAGGALGGSVMPKVGDLDSIFNSRGQKVGERLFDTLYYQPCNNCGKPMHRGTMGFSYCDPCDTKNFGVYAYVWYKSEEELKQASL